MSDLHPPIDASFKKFPFDAYGLGHLTAPERDQFRAELSQELHDRVGSALSEGMSDQEIEEFSAFMERVPGFAAAWLQHHAPGFETDPDWSDSWGRLGQQINDEEARYAEMASLIWLQLKRPNLRNVVTRVHTQLLLDVADRLRHD